MKQSQKLKQSESLVEQLESDIKVLKANHSENLGSKCDKLAQTESIFIIIFRVSIHLIYVIITVCMVMYHCGH